MCPLVFHSFMQMLNILHNNLFVITSGATVWCLSFHHNSYKMTNVLQSHAMALAPRASFHVFAMFAATPYNANSAAASTLSWMERSTFPRRTSIALCTSKACVFHLLEPPAHPLNHKLLLAEYPPTPIHRTSLAPVAPLIKCPWNLVILAFSHSQYSSLSLCFLFYHQMDQQ